MVYLTNLRSNSGNTKIMGKVLSKGPVINYGEGGYKTVEREHGSLKFKPYWGTKSSTL